MINKVWLTVACMCRSIAGCKVALLLMVAATLSSCGIYSFNEKSQIDADARTVNVRAFENRAQYVNPQLTPALTERLRNKIISQTRLVQTNNENAHYDIQATITEYSVSTSAVTNTAGQQQASVNRLTVSISVKVNNQLRNTNEDFNVSRSFDFGANQSLQAAEASLLNEMVRNLTDEIFNQIFSKW